MRKLSNAELNRPGIDEFRLKEKIPFWVVLDNIRSQHNIGSVFRTVDAFNLAGIVLCGISATPPHREIHKTALGAEESVQWHYTGSCPEAVNMLRQQGFTAIAVEQAEGSVPLGEFKLPEGKRMALIFGNEINGVSQEVMDIVDGCIEIPQFGTKHSINVAVSAGIVIYRISDLFLHSDIP